MPNTDTRAALETPENALARALLSFHACMGRWEIDITDQAPPDPWKFATEWLPEIASALARSAPEEHADAVAACEKIRAIVGCVPDLPFRDLPGCVEAIELARSGWENEARLLAGSAPEERGEGEEGEELRCDKCNGRDIHTRYRKKGEQLAGWPDYERAREDCLRRYCRTCGAKWIDPLATPPAPVEGERERAVQMFDEYAELVAGVFRRAVETATAMLRKEGGDALALLKCALAEEIRVANEMEERIRHRLTSHPVQGEREEGDPVIACPVCGGRGVVQLGFYGDRGGAYSVSAINLETCRTCNGTTVYPPPLASPAPSAPEEES